MDPFAEKSYILFRESVGCSPGGKTGKKSLRNGALNGKNYENSPFGSEHGLAILEG